MPNAKLFVDPTLVNAASPYYGTFPVEPTPSASAADWLTVKGKPINRKTQSLEELLTVIAGNASSGDDILIVGHGNKSGLKLIIGEAHKRPDDDVDLELLPLDAIRRNQAGQEDDATTETTLKLKPGGFAKLRPLIEKVQNLNLDRVDVRACNTGQDPIVMSALQQFFNCNIFCCPKLLDSYGVIGYQPFASDAAYFDKWVKEHDGAIVSGATPDRFALFQDLSKGVNTAAIAESAKGAKAWADAHLPPSTAFTGRNALSYHGLTDMRARMFFAGDAEFRAQLVEARKGQVPSRKVDIKNAPILPD